MEQENKILVNGLPKSPSGRLTKYFSGLLFNYMILILYYYRILGRCVIISRFGLRQARVEGDSDRGNRGLDFSHLLAAFLRVGSGEASGSGGGHPR